MKFKFFSSLLLFSILTISGACSTDEAKEDDKITVEDIAEIKAIAQSGEWSITYYFDNEVDKATDYSGFIFTFNENGVLGVANGDLALSGAWSVTDSGSDDVNESAVNFEVFFASPPNFQELTDDWNLANYTSTKIELVDKSNDGDPEDYLTFEKN